MNLSRGIDVQVYGQSTDLSDGVGKVAHTTDKGERKATPMYGYGVLQPDFAAVDTSRLTLVMPYVGNEDLATGDMFVIIETGERYLADGDQNSWLVFDRRGVHHYEIPMKAMPGE